MTLEISNISRSFGRYPALKDVSLRVEEGEFVALLGPSGSGKTTLLRILAGLETPDAGSVIFQGEDYLKQTPRQRRVGLVFQHYALFRHMTVAKNIGFGLRVRPSKDRPSASEIQSRVEKLLSLIQLEGLGDRYPAQLSGGQRQRVALARALAIEPRMLLLDEPFGALDAKVRRDLRRWLRQVHDETGVTTIFVTHDQEEALDLADRVAVMSQGKLEQMDTPETLYAHPNSAFVHGFLGSGVQLPGAVANGVLSVDGWSAPTDAPDGPAFLCARAEDFHAAETGVEARIESAGARGDHVRIEAAVGEQVLELTRPSGDPLAQAPVNSTIRLAPKRFHVFPG